jgi:membrane-bound inhibitor of C-type lysozyme
MQKIKWNKAIVFSRIVIVVAFLAVLCFVFFAGAKYENKTILGEPTVRAKFVCPDKTVISVDFYTDFVRIKTPLLGTIHLPRTISGSGARYANNDGSIVFWNKGDSAFITQNDEIILDNCVTKI